MSKCFNVNGVCEPGEHYMVDLEDRLVRIKGLVDAGKYFTINRARQFGKTTILHALSEYLGNDYYVVSMDFQMQMSHAKFKSENSFSLAFAKGFVNSFRANPDSTKPGYEDAIREFVESYTLSDEVRQPGRACATGCPKGYTMDSGNYELVELFQALSSLCSKIPGKMVLMIDEVDHVVSNQVFLDFLAQLRGYYINRNRFAAFQSVILASVCDIKNLKRKIRPDEEHRDNSPWNIAVDFDIDMSFSVQDVAGMLADYERDCQTGMDIDRVAEVICEYTSGYPYLVSRICMLLDEQAAKADGIPQEAWSAESERVETSKLVWSENGITEAVKMLLNKSNMLFDDMRKQIMDYPELKKMLYAILFYGQSFAYNPNNWVIDIGEMFGFLKESKGQVVIANRIFETWIYNLFLSEDLLEDRSYKAASEIKNQFIRNGRLDMDLVMTKFMQHFTEVYADYTDAFREENGRRLFLLYLKPIINGEGNYYIEAQTRDQRRTDVIIDYLGRQQVVEMKIWRGEEYNRRGEEQLFEYLDYYRLDKGYLLSFNFNKKKQVGAKEIAYKGKRILEVVV